MEAHIDSAHKGVEPIQYHCEVCNKGYMKKYRYVFKEIPTYLYLHFVNCLFTNFVLLYIFFLILSVQKCKQKHREKEREKTRTKDSNLPYEKCEIGSNWKCKFCSVELMLIKMKKVRLFNK